jgi:hypothetical protein
VRYGTTAGAALLVLWLIIGVLAAAQRGYFDRANASCPRAGTTTITVIAGPLNYLGVNPKMNCEVPQPSK